MPFLKEVPAGVELLVLVQPRASRTRVIGEHDGRLKVALAAPPVDGEANAALLDFVRKAFALRKADVELLDGDTSRRKRLLLRAVSGARAREVVKSLGP